MVNQLNLNKSISDVSFIVIAKNEEFAISKCLLALTSPTLINCEIICVDSDSTDNTLNIMKNFAKEHTNVKILHCSGLVSCAVARNIGIKHAQYSYIFFVDGDTEINSDFVIQAQAELKMEKVGAVTGNLKESIYNSNYTKLKKTQFKDRYVSVNTQVNWTGGNFMTTRDVINKIGWFDERFFVNEDMDYTLRINQHYNINQHKIVLGTHYSQNYRRRLFTRIVSGVLVNQGMLLRKHIKNKIVLWRLLRAERKGFILGTLFYASLFIQIVLISMNILSLQFLIIFCALVFIIDISHAVLTKKNIIVALVTHYIYTIFSLYGFFVKPSKKNRLTTNVRIITKKK